MPPVGPRSPRGWGLSHAQVQAIHAGTRLRNHSFGNLVFVAQGPASIIHGEYRIPAGTVGISGQLPTSYHYSLYPSLCMLELPSALQLPEGL